MDEIYTVAFSPDGKTLASSVSDLDFDFGGGSLLPPSCALGKIFVLSASQLPFAV